MPNISKLLEQNDAGFKRYTGIHKATFEQMLDAMQEYEASKTKSGRPSDLSLEAQILLTLTYQREQRTLYHIGMDFSVHESSASRIVRKVKDVLIHSGRFDLPRKLPHVKPEDINQLAVIIGATETLIERPKKPKQVIQWKKETTYLRSSDHRKLANRSYT